MSFVGEEYGTGSIGAECVSSGMNEKTPLRNLRHAFPFGSKCDTVRAIVNKCTCAEHSLKKVFAL